MVFSVECPEFPNDGKCHNRGKSYNVGEEVPENEQPICSAACHCLDVGDNINFNCALIECPDVFNRIPPSCVRQEVKGQCCANYECGKIPISGIRHIDIFFILKRIHFHSLIVT